MRRYRRLTTLHAGRLHADRNAVSPIQPYRYAASCRYCRIQEHQGGSSDTREYPSLRLQPYHTAPRNIERRLGIKLICRQAKGLTLTPAGEAFLCRALVILEDIDSLDRRNTGSRQRRFGTRAHFASGASVESALPALSRFLRAHPGVSIDLKEGLSRDILSSVAQDRADIGIVAGARSAGLQFLPYRQDRLVLTVGARHVLANRMSIRFSEALDFDYIEPLEGSALHALLNQSAREINRVLNARVRVKGFEVVCRMIEANLGVGILPESIARRYERSMSIHLVQLQDDWAIQSLEICVRSLTLLPRFARELVDLLLKSVVSMRSNRRSGISKTERDACEMGRERTPQGCGRS